MYSFKDVMREYFEQLNLAGKLKSKETQDQETRFLNFYQDKVKVFNDIIDCVDIKYEMEVLKQKKSTNYEFSERNKKFIITLLEEYSRKLDPIRRAEIYKADSEFVIYVYEGFVDIFKDVINDSKLVDAVCMKMINRLNVPTHKLQSVLKSTYRRFEKMTNEKMSESKLGISVLERYQWLLGLEEDADAFITKWEDLFTLMSELRMEEIDDIAEKKCSNISQNEIEEAYIDFEFAEEISATIDADEEYQNLEHERCRILGIEYKEPVKKPITTLHNILDMRQKAVIQKKRPFVKKVEKQFYDINIRLQSRFDELRIEVIRKHIPDYKPIVKMEYDMDYSSLISTEELLQKAIGQLKEEWECKERDKHRVAVELPDIDFEKLKEKINNYMP